MFGALVDYWYYTGDSSYNEVTTQALLFQVSTAHPQTQLAQANVQLVVSS